MPYSLIRAIISNDEDSFNRLLDSDPQLAYFVSDHHSYTPLHYAARHGRTSMIQPLLESGADPNARTTSCQKKPWQMAASSGHIKTAKAICTISGLVL